MAPSHRVHLIDASPYIFRAFFSLPDIQAPDGSSVGAVLGFANFLIKFFREEEPTHVALTFDESLNTSFRNEIYPEYKAQRELPPPELEAQLENCQAIGRAFGVATFAYERSEADDLIGTLCKQILDKGHRVVVVTSDKDLAQLVSSRVAMYDFARGVTLRPRDVREKFGVRPAQIPDFLGLAGDSVDNIPGVPGVGKKTAVSLLQAFRDLDHLYARLDRVASLDLRGATKLGARLEEYRDLAFLSRELATVAVDAPVSAKLTELRWKRANGELLVPLLDRLGFERLRKRVPL